MNAVEICHLYISMGHNFVGHHGLEPDTHPVSEVAEIECVAGRGIRGDRYFDFKDDYKVRLLSSRWTFLVNFAARCNFGTPHLLPLGGT